MPEKIGIGTGVPFSAGSGGGGGGGPTLLSTGVYWSNGSVSLGPYVGNYTSTTKLTDGSSGDTGTGEQASAPTADVMTWVHVLASPINITGWQTTIFFQGGLGLSYYYWDGVAWVALVNLGGATPFGFSYASFTGNGVFSGSPSATIFRAVGSETDTSTAAIKVTDSRPS